MFCSYLLRERIVSFLGQVSYEDQIKSSARVESLGTALASTTLQDKPVYISMYIFSDGGGRSKSIPVVHSSCPVHRLLTAVYERE